MKPISSYSLNFIFSFLFTALYNFSFFKQTTNIYNFSGLNIVHVSSLFVVLVFLIFIFLNIFTFKYITKILLILLLIISSFAAYFMDAFHIILDTSMIDNILQTNYDESVDLLNVKLILYVIFLGIVPSFVVYKVPLLTHSIKKNLLYKFGFIFMSLLIIFMIMFSFSKFYTSFFRENKPLRYNVNPLYWLYSIGKYTSNKLKFEDKTFHIIANDAKKLPALKPRLLIVVVGESARADRFFLHQNQTNLIHQNIINLSNVSSCGTSTAISVPCMFSFYGKDTFETHKAKYTQNVLDILNKNGVHVLWRDNNSDSKGVALRVCYEDFKSKKQDIAMLDNLDKYVSKDTIIVLHQMGNHGPAYYKRYPKEFEKFTPTCNTNQLQNCTKEQISNSYDNAILYTNYFLSKSIDFLKKYEKNYEVGLIYMSDHGESLGENGIYLHSMPYLIAPKEQTKVAAMMWLANVPKTQSINKSLSHDNLFSTILGFFKIQTKVYDKNMDILNDIKYK